MKTTSPQLPLGTTGELNSHRFPSSDQVAAVRVAERDRKRLQRNLDQAALRDLFRRARHAAKMDLDKLAQELDEGEHYDSKISEAENGVGGRHIQDRWFAPLMQHQAALDVIAAYWCARAGKKPPEAVEEMSPAEAEELAVEEVRASPELREIVRGRIAKKRGLSSDKVPL